MRKPRATVGLVNVLESWHKVWISNYSNWRGKMDEWDGNVLEGRNNNRRHTDDDVMLLLLSARVSSATVFFVFGIISFSSRNLEQKKIPRLFATSSQNHNCLNLHKVGKSFCKNVLSVATKQMYTMRTTTPGIQINICLVLTENLSKFGVNCRVNLWLQHVYAEI